MFLNACVVRAFPVNFFAGLTSKKLIVVFFCLRFQLIDDLGFVDEGDLAVAANAATDCADFSSEVEAFDDLQELLVGIG